MSSQELEALIRDNIRDIYKAEYKGKLRVEEKLNGYLIEIGMLTPEAPIVIYTELKGDKLKKFIREEIQNRQLSPENYGYISTVYPTSCEPINTRCCEER